MRQWKVMRSVVCVSAWLGAAACSAEQESVSVDSVSVELRAISQQEALADFDTMVESFRANYGPMQRKEQRYGFSFDEHVQQSRQELEQAQSGVARERVFQSFIARFNDVHVSLSPALPTEESPGFGLPLDVTPIGDAYVVYFVGKLPENTSALRRGDELLAIDGVPPAEIVKRFEPLIGMPNPLTKKHFLAMLLTQRRPIYADGIVAGAPVQLRVRHPEGDEQDVPLTWQPFPSALTRNSSTPPAAGSGDAPQAYSDSAAEVITAELNSNGGVVPFFMTQEVQQRFQTGNQIYPTGRALADFGVPADTLLDIQFFAVRYNYQGKRILLVRIPDFDRSLDTRSVLNRLNYLRALLSEQQATSDALVLDDTHNPGGAILFAQLLASMFAEKQLDGVVAAMHADRFQISSYLQAANGLRGQSNPTEADRARADELESYARQLDELLSAGTALSAPIPLPGTPSRPEPDRVRWTKPLLVLIDELSVSAADLFPLLVKANQLGTLFGQRTSGAGGNVELIGRLPHSAMQLKLTRGSFTAFDPSGAYPDERFVEDNGVTPAIEYSHTLEDFRAGYVGYVETFSKTLVDSLD